MLTKQGIMLTTRQAALNLTFTLTLAITRVSRASC